jgi:hypothetical protein
MEVGFGKEVQREDTCDIAYEVFTQGGLYLDSLGVGMVRFCSTVISSYASASWCFLQMHLRFLTLKQ